MYYPHTWAEIDFDAMGYNLQLVKNNLPGHSEVMAVVKADAYGFGAIEVSRFLVSQGVNLLAVSVLSEGIELRRAGISTPILVFNYVPESNCDMILHYDLTPTIYSLEFARTLNKTAQQWNKVVKVHLNIDTGMSRLGLLGRHLERFIKEMKKLTFLEIDCVYSHFASADIPSEALTNQQYTAFLAIVQNMRDNGWPKIRTHMANSAAFLRGIAVECDYVRVGAAIYGFYPSDISNYTSFGSELRPVITLKTVVGHIKTLDAGVPISYGCTYRTKGETRIATLPVGYADGYRRILGNRGEVLINGKRAPVVGVVCMDQCMVDVNGIEDVRVGDPVVLFGTQDQNTISLDEIAAWCETINYEIPCLINRRVPRYYLMNGRQLVKRDHLDNL